MDFVERLADGMKDPAEGTLQVVATSVPADSGEHVRAITITGVLRVPGLPPTAIEYNGNARPVNWPQRGQLLPALVDRASPTGAGSVVIDWDRVPTHLQLAEQLAEQLRREAGSERPPGAGTADGV